MASVSKSTVERIRSAVNRQRLLDTAIALIGIPSPTRSAGNVSDRLAQILEEDGFSVERPETNWPEAPAVVVRHDSGRRGRVLQFDGHLDTVHLPFVPPHLENGILYGSGCSDMKAGIAAFVEALRVLKETETLTGGGVLITCHDHHEGPWGDRRQVHALINEGYLGDAVMLPEYLADRLPLAGRGMAIFTATISREGEPVHEVLQPSGTPDVLGAGAELVSSLREWNRALAKNSHPHAGVDSVFVGQIQSGEIYNQVPIECKVTGTRRWITPGTVEQVEKEFRAVLERLAQSSRTKITVDYAVQGDAFQLEETDPIVTAFQAAHEAIARRPLPFGGKPFLDDGNAFFARAGLPALTHGPNAKGAHTMHESVPVDELVRVAQVYALTAVGYCRPQEP